MHCNTKMATHHGFVPYGFVPLALVVTWIFSLSKWVWKYTRRLAL